MEPDLYWQCDCGHTNLTAASVFKRTGSATHVCSECEQPTQLTRPDCTAERRTSAVEVPTGGMEGVLTVTDPQIGGYRLTPGSGYVHTPHYDSGATVNPAFLSFPHLTAALEAMTKERDEARAEVERLNNEPVRGMQRVQSETIRDLQAEVERLNKEADSLAQQREHWQLRFGEVCDERNAATARIAALEAVIKAQTTYNTAALDLRDAWDAAGLKEDC